jgi:hypothetical protein
VVALLEAILISHVVGSKGPSVTVLPGPGKPFEVFQSDDNACRQWAEQQIGESPEAAANKTLIAGTAIWTMVGAALGALIGSTYGHAGTGAAIGAGSGLVEGVMLSSGPASATGWELQRRYDIAYQQCMFARGNQVPGSMWRSRRIYPVPPPPPPPGFSQGEPVPPPPDAYPPP